MESPLAPEGTGGAEDASAYGGTPWERRAELGAFRAFRETVVQALFEPGILFPAARLDRGGAQLGFALLCSAGGSVIGQLLANVLFARQNEQARRLLAGRLADVPPPLRALLEAFAGGSGRASLAASLGFLVLAPVFSLAFLYLNAGIAHFFAVLFGQARRGFGGTFAAVAYSCAPFLLSAIPGCGGLIAIFWFIVLAAVAMKLVHGMSTGGAVASVLGPYLLCCGSVCALSASAAFVLARMARGSP